MGGLRMKDYKKLLLELVDYIKGQEIFEMLYSLAVYLMKGKKY